MPFEYTEPTGFLVETTFNKGADWVNVYRGQSRDEAHRICEFWDARQDTRFIDYAMLPKDALSVAMRKFDALEEYLQTA